jgi:Tfp pilus assembly protein PilN
LIEVNLLPGGSKRSARGRPKLSLRLPKLEGRLPEVDRLTVGVGVVVVAALAGAAWLASSVSGDVEELEVQLEVAVRDSIRLADVLEESNLLQARADSIAERVAIIQQIDQDRYVWPHLMDEVARAMPDYAWLTGLFQTSTPESEELIFQIQGQAGTYFALTTFMENLEASPFITGVQLIESQQVAVAGDAVGSDRLLYEFTVEALGETPPPEVIETVPLFGPSVAPPPTGTDD